MGFAIDVLFVDQNNRVTRIVAGLAPFHLAVGPTGSVGVLEMASGSLANGNCKVGDEIAFVPI